MQGCRLVYVTTSTRPSGRSDRSDRRRAVFRFVASVLDKRGLIWDTLASGNSRSLGTRANSALVSIRFSTRPTSTSDQVFGESDGAKRKIDRQHDACDSQVPIPAKLQADAIAAARPARSEGRRLQSTRPQ